VFVVVALTARIVQPQELRHLLNREPGHS
jgi:hypothetical protein